MVTPGKSPLKKNIESESDFFSYAEKQNLVNRD